MTKELSIENIKKELIDKISNNSDILEASGIMVEA